MKISEFNDILKKYSYKNNNDKKTFNSIIYLIENGSNNENIIIAVEYVINNYVSYKIKTVTASAKCYLMLDFDLSKIPTNVSKALQNRAATLKKEMDEENKKNDDNIISLLG